MKPSRQQKNGRNASRVTRNSIPFFQRERSDRRSSSGRTVRKAYWAVQKGFHKSIGNGTLTFKELEDVVLHVEVALHHRPRSYLENNVELPVLTPSSLLNINPNQLPEPKARYEYDIEFRKRVKLLNKCKQNLWWRGGHVNTYEVYANDM